jgi:phospholipid transport system substrate-binding protein
MQTRREFLLAGGAAGLLLATGLGRPSVAFANELSQGAAHFIADLGKQALDALANVKQMSQAEVAAKFRGFLQDSFDTQTIGRFVLGRYWNVATPEQRQEYMRLFEDLIVAVYSKRFSDYTGGAGFEVVNHRPEGERDAVVSSRIMRPSGGPPVAVDWRVRRGNAGYKVIDVAVEGLSMSVTQRDEFSSVIERGGGNVQALLDALRNQTQGRS